MSLTEHAAALDDFNTDWRDHLAFDRAADTRAFDGRERPDCEGIDRRPACAVGCPCARMLRRARR